MLFALVQIEKDSLQTPKFHAKSFIAEATNIDLKAEMHKYNSWLEAQMKQLINFLGRPPTVTGQTHA